MANAKILRLLEKKRELLKELIYVDKQIEKLIMQEKPELETEKFSPTINEDSELENKVTELIIELGIPAHIKGYHYIRKAIIMVVEDINLIGAVTNELYPAVAKAYGATPQRVERAIRHAIMVGYKKCEEHWRKNSIYDHPTNAEFIATVADKLRKNK